jgi:hypothetical protein
MKASLKIKSLLMTTALVAVSTGTLILTQNNPKDLSADILTSNDADFYLWYIKDEPGEQRWEIPFLVGSMATLPLGITADDEIVNAVPMDSVEFKLMGIPDYLQFYSISTFPGFHADANWKTGAHPGTFDLMVYITPEVLDETGGVPAEPSDANEIGDLISGTTETLRVNFQIAEDPYLSPPISVTGILTARDGEFTRYTADGNPFLPGTGNPGSIEIDPILTGGVIQMTSTKALGRDQVQIDFTLPVLNGNSDEGSELTSNYYIYKCGSNVPAPDSGDANSSDVNSCRQKQQDSVVTPGQPVLAQRDNDDPYRVRLTANPSAPFSHGAYYIVRVENVANDTGDYQIPPEGIYSQMFQYKGHPVIESVTPTDMNTLLVDFSYNTCEESPQYGAGVADNYEVISCNELVTIEECVLRNTIPGSDLAVTDIEFDGLQAVTLTTEEQDPDTWYVVRAKNVSDEFCDPLNAIPETPEYYSSQFEGFGGDGGGGVPSGPRNPKHWTFRFDRIAFAMARKNRSKATWRSFTVLLGCCSSRCRNIRYFRSRKCHFLSHFGRFGIESDSR